MNAGGVSRIEQFEQAIVFRSARILPLVLAVITTLALVVAIVALLYSVIPSLKPSEPKPTPEPAQVSVNNSEITDYLNRMNQAAPGPAAGTTQTANTNPSPSAPAARVVSAEAQALANEMDAVRKQAVALNLPWANEYQTVCQSVFFGNCYGARTVLASRGVSGYIERAFSHHNEESSTSEEVQIGDQSYRVNPSHSDVKMAILKELEGVLATAHPDDAMKLLNAWGKLREDMEKERDAAIKSDAEQKAEEYAKAQAEYEKTIATKQAVRRTSLITAGMALGWFVLLGLILAVLAIERHTRLLEAQLEAAKLAPGASMPTVHV
jgi:Skp family chaperone for outer membrane proteins